MRFLAQLLLATLISGCATIEYQPYEGKNNLYEGVGGTKLVVDGIDFWANGTPPLTYSIIGIVTSEIGSGRGDEAIIRSTVAKKVRDLGGNAAIQVYNNSSFAGIIRATPSLYIAAGVTRMQFAVIRYVQ